MKGGRGEKKGGRGGKVMKKVVMKGFVRWRWDGRKEKGEGSERGWEEEEGKSIAERKKRGRGRRTVRGKKEKGGKGK